LDTSNFLLKIVHECKDLFYLEEMIKEHSSEAAIRAEDYESAAKIRDQIKKIIDSS